MLITPLISSNSSYEKLYLKKTREAMSYFYSSGFPWTDTNWKTETGRKKKKKDNGIKKWFNHAQTLDSVVCVA